MTQKKHRSSSLLGKILRFCLYLIGLIVILLVLIYLSAGYLVKTGISTFVPKITQTSASVQDVDLSLLSGKIEMKGLKIGNPEGFVNATVFELGRIYVEFSPMSVFTDKIMIHEVLIDKTAVSAEINTKGKINLVELNNRIQSYTQSDAALENTTSEKTQPTQTTEKSAKSVVIKDLKIDNSALNLGIAGQTVKLNLPDIHKTDIGEGKDKKTFGETIALVLSYFSSESLQALKESSNALIKQGLSGVTDLVGQGREAAEKGVTELKNKAQSVTEGLKGLFQ